MSKAVSNHLEAEMILKLDHSFQERQDLFAQISNHTNLEISVISMTSP